MSARKYAAKRQSKKWLEGAPPEVLCLLDHVSGVGDRYHCVYASCWHRRDDGSYGEGADRLGNTTYFARGMNTHPMHPQGIGMSFEWKAYDLSACRKDRKTWRPIRWKDLPPDVQKCIELDAREIREERSRGTI